MKKIPTLFIGSCLFVYFSILGIEVLAQDTSKSATKPTASAAELAKKLANPIANMISLPFQANFDNGIGSYNGSKMVLNIQPVIPISLTKDLNLITRWILPIVSQYNMQGDVSSQSGLGDAVVSGFVSPKNSSFTWGVGPVLLIPTATNSALGSGKFGFGPTAVVLKQANGWTIGGLANHIWSVAGSESRNNVNASFINPFVTHNWKSGAGIALNLEYTHDWENDINVLVLNFPYASAVTKFGNQIVSFGVGPRFHFAPSTRPDYGIRAAISLVFPK